MKLSILIPTYNRSKYLLNNLRLLESIIQQTNKEREIEIEIEIEIIISNNNSTDETDSIVNNYIKTTSLAISYFLQDKNIGLEKNALFVLEKAESDYVMYLGDDDFIELDYYIKVLRLIRESKIQAIIPNYIPIDLDGVILGKSRDNIIDDKFFEAGFKSCLENSWRGHQLSGLVFKRKGLLESYKINKVNNIYLFIYFVAFSCLNGEVCHITKYPIKVTQPGQQKKDWSYGKDGLLNEIFDNYKKLPLSVLGKTRLQIKVIKIQFWRLSIYKSIGYKAYLDAILSANLSNNSTLLFKFWLPYYILIRLFKGLL